jgi:Phage integrase, N-terminal SAM-like domain
MGVYLDPAGRARSAGTFDSKRVALHEARAAEAAIESGSWIDPSLGKITFRDYVEQHWWSSRHLELTTKASDRGYLDKHFLPFFGEMPMRMITPSTVQPG